MVRSQDVSLVDFTVEQLQLQSLIESGLVPSVDLNLATYVANVGGATFDQLVSVKILLDKLLAEPPKVKYEFTNIFKRLNTSFTQKYSGVFLNYRITLNKGIRSANHPGAIYMVSEKPGLGYIGRIDLDHSVVLAKGHESLKEDLIKFLMDLNSLPVSDFPPLIHEPKPETLAQQVSRGPFDPAIMKAMLEGKHDEY